MSEQPKARIIEFTGEYRRTDNIGNFSIREKASRAHVSKFLTAFAQQYANGEIAWFHFDVIEGEEIDKLKLNNCPLCGKKPVINTENVSIKCQNCGLIIEKDADKDIVEAMMDWNNLVRG